MTPLCSFVFTATLFVALWKEALCEVHNPTGADSAAWPRRTEAPAADSPLEDGPLSAALTLHKLHPFPTHISEGPKDAIVKAGDEILLHCRINSSSSHSSPPASIRWLFNGKELAARGEDMRVHINPNASSLRVSPARRSDSGKYSCAAQLAAAGRLADPEEGGEETTASANVTVLDSQLTVLGPTNQSVLIGSNVLMPCRVDDGQLPIHVPPPSISWAVNDETLPPNGDAPRRININKDGSLHINQVGPDNIGHYRCAVRLPTGDGGSIRGSASAWLRIIEKPSMPQSIRVSLANETTPARVRIDWVDSFDGNSPIVKYLVEWRTLATTNGQWSHWEAVLDNIVPEQCCSVLVDNQRPSTTAQFRVTAYNRHGAGRPSLPSPNITMPQQPPAAAPRSVGASARSANSVMVQWQPPPPEQWNVTNIRGYLLRYRLAGYTTAEWNERNVSNEHARNALIEPLITWREYEVQVAAYNERGLGVFSKPVEVTTLEGVPMQPPKNIQAVTINSTGIRVSFDAPDQQQVPGVNLGYKLELWKDGAAPIVGTAGKGESPFKRVLVLPQYTRMTEVIGGLEKFGHYNLTLLCFTAAGDGPRSEPLEVATLEDVPGPVESLTFDQVMSTSAVVQWTPPVEPNGIIQKYIIRHWGTKAAAGDAEGSPHSVEVSAHELSYMLDDLTPTTRYTVDIRAATKAGAGARMEASFESGVTPTLPDKPLSLSISEVGARSALLTFTPGFNGHSYIKRWIVEGRMGASSIFSTVYNISAPKAKSIKVEGLRPNTRYQLRLMAENVRGRGAPSDPTHHFETPSTFPEHPPEHIYAEPNSSEQLAIGWSPLMSAHWNGDAVGYVLSYRPVKKKKERGEEMDAATPKRTANGEGQEVAPVRRPLPTEVEPSDGWEEVKISNPKANEYRLGRLRPFTTYQVRVCAENSFGKSNASSPITATTYESTPSGPPQNVVAVADERHPLVMVEWAAVEASHQNGLITGYTIRLIPEQESIRSDFSIEKKVTADGGAHHAEVDGLHPFTAYRVLITASTLLGEGPPNGNAPVVTTAESTPSPPTNVSFDTISKDYLRLTWGPPAEQNGKLTGYAIRYWQADGGDNTDAAAHWEKDAIQTQLTPTITSFTATSLSPNTTYYFAVSAETSAGFGDEQRIYTPTIPTSEQPSHLPTPPAPVRNRQQPESATALALNWGPEQFNSTSTPHLRGVELCYQRANSDEWLHPTRAKRQWIPADSDGYVLAGLVPNTAYRVRIRLHGDVSLRSGWSAESDWMRTLEAAPAEPPMLLQAKPYESSSALLKWTPVEKAKWNSDRISYRVLYRPYPSADNDSYLSEDIAAGSGGGSGLEKEAKMPREHILKGLSSFRHYMVQMKSFNPRGASHASKPLFVYVGYSVPKQTIRGLTAEGLSSTSIRVHWDEWERQEEDPIAGYRLSYAPIPPPERWGNDSGDPATLESLVVERTEHSLTDLRKNAEYQIAVAGYNRAGEGPTTVVRVRTLEDTPGPVGHLLFHDILLDSVNVSWTPPAQPNGRILNYIVNYHTFKMEEQFRKEVQERTQLTYLVASNLEENTTYYFSVRAETSAGLGIETADNVTLGFNEGAPEAPSQPEVVPEHSTFLVKWIDNAQGTSPIRGHIIQAQRTAAASPPTSQPTPIPLNGDEHQAKEGDVPPRPMQWHLGDELAEDVPHRASHPIGEWVTISTLLGGDTTAHRISYKQLEPASYYVFRLFARNQLGVGRASPQSEQLFVPALLPEEPFYTKWWFLTIIALVALIVVLLFTAMLCFTGGRGPASIYSGGGKGGKSHHGGAFDTLQLSDGGIANYGLQSKQLRKTGDLFPRPGTHTSWISNNGRGGTGAPQLYGSIASEMDRRSSTSSNATSGGHNAVQPVSSMYHVLATDALPHHAHSSAFSAPIYNPFLGMPGGAGSETNRNSRSVCTSNSPRSAGERRPQRGERHSPTTPARGIALGGGSPAAKSPLYRLRDFNVHASQRIVPPPPPDTNHYRRMGESFPPAAAGQQLNAAESGGSSGEEDELSGAGQNFALHYRTNADDGEVLRAKSWRRAKEHAARLKLKQRHRPDPAPSRASAPSNDGLLLHHHHNGERHSALLPSSPHLPSIEDCVPQRNSTQLLAAEYSLDHTTYSRHPQAPHERCPNEGSHAFTPRNSATRSIPPQNAIEPAQLTSFV